jgi:hypothetical protein
MKDNKIVVFRLSHLKLSNHEWINSCSSLSLVSGIYPPSPPPPPTFPYLPWPAFLCFCLCWKKLIHYILLYDIMSAFWYCVYACIWVYYTQSHWLMFMRNNIMMRNLLKLVNYRWVWLSHSWRWNGCSSRPHRRSVVGRKFHILQLCFRT